jgi:hypothetical protein
MQSSLYTFAQEKMPLFLAYISSPSSLSSGPESKCEVKFESRIQSLELLQRLAEMTCFID